MTHPDPARARASAALRISLLYALFGTLYIVIGDVGVSRLAGDAASALVVQLVKGGIFVVGSATLVYHLVRHAMRAQAEAERALRKAQKLDAVARLAGGVAHEFNNILTAIIGHAALVADGDEEQDLRRHAEEVRRAAMRATGLTRQLLLFSGAHVNQPTLLDLGTLLHDLRPALLRTLGDDVELHVDVAESLWTPWCDVAQLQQLVMNLVLNAQEAMPDGGSLHIRAANAVVDGRESVPAGEWVHLSITDTGHGMSAETLDHLFEPFFTTKQQGAGLGLATVHGTVRQCGGHVRVDSERGVGTTVEVFLPRGVAPDGPILPVVAAEPARAATLIVVEDDDAVRDLTVRILRREGHEVLAARGAVEALRIAEQRPDISLVVADIVMPGMDGIELGQHLRRARPNLPILFTSGYTRGSLADTGQLPDGTAFLEKPYRPDQLVARVSALLDAVRTA